MTDLDLTAEAELAARQNAEDKADAVELTPAVPVAPKKVSLDDPSVKEIDGYEKFASNDGTFVLSRLDDGTNVEAGNIMESQARAPAHQQHELTVEEDAPGFEQAAALMTPRGNPHYREGGSIADVKAGSGEV